MAKSRIVAATVAAVLLGVCAPRGVLAQGQGGADAAPAAADPAAMTDGEKAAAGCGVAAAGSLAATYLAGPSEIVLLWGGGMLIPSGSVMLAVTLLGQIGASACAIGVVATPTVLWAYDQSGHIADRLIQASAGIGRQAAGVFGEAFGPGRAADQPPGGGAAPR